MRNIGRRLLGTISSGALTSRQPAESQFRIGFITPPFKDNKIPVTDHLHAHAYLAPADQLGWWRGVAYSPLAWYAIDDLIAEIRLAFSFQSIPPFQLIVYVVRESASNNRVKSGYENRTNAPIDTVPEAGARTGTANGDEHTNLSLVVPDVEDGLAGPSPSCSTLSFASISSSRALQA